jgi:integrase
MPSAAAPRIPEKRLEKKVEGLAEVIQFKPQEQKEKKARRDRGAGRTFKPRHHGKESQFYWIQYYARGRQVRESCKSDKLAVAERLLRQRLGEAAAGTLRPQNAERLKYDDLRAVLISEYVVKGRKWLRTGKDGKRYISQLTALDKFFEGYRVTAITSDRIRDFVQTQQAQGLMNGTINRSLALFRRMFRLALREKKLRVDDVPYFQLLKESKPRQGFLEYNDFLKLRAKLPKEIRPAVTMAFYTGMRLGEILGLHWKDVSLLDSQAFLGETKNGEPRTVPLSRELLEILKLERQNNPRAEFVFTREGRQIRDFRRAWWNACVRAGFGRFEHVLDPEAGKPKIEKRKQPVMRYEGLIFHDLRRSGVRNLDRAGVSRTVAMAISGHKTESVYRGYNIVSARDLQLATAKLESYLKSENGAVSGRSEESGGSAGEPCRVLTT